MNAAAEWVIRRPWWAALGVAILLALLLTRCGGGESTSSVASTPDPTASNVGTVASETLEASTTEPTAVPGEVVEESEASRVAIRFVQAWLADPAQEKAWLAGVKPYVTSALYEAYELALPGKDAIPNAHTSGDPTVLLDGPALFRYRVLLDDDSAVQVEVISDGDAPLVSGIEPERH